MDDLSITDGEFHAIRELIDHMQLSVEDSQLEQRMEMLLYQFMTPIFDHDTEIVSAVTAFTTTNGVDLDIGGVFVQFPDGGTWA